MSRIKSVFLFLLTMLVSFMVNAQGLDLEVSPYELGYAQENDSYQSPAIFNVSSVKQRYLEHAEMAIGTILRSHHFSKYDYHDYNESHNGIYLSFNEWSLGSYNNSANVRSTFFTYSSGFYQKEYLKLKFMTGVANGYEGWKNALGDYIPILGVSAQWRYLKTILLPDAIAFGLELPLN